MATPTMKAIVIEGLLDSLGWWASGPNAFQLREVLKPVPLKDEVLIKVKHVGICGTDLEIISGHMGYYVTGKAKFPGLS